jgi:hypothetical protein
VKPVASVWRDKRAIAGCLLLLCALACYFCAVLRLDLHKTAFLDLGPYSDACEYFGQATSLLKTGAPTIQIGYDRLPSRYPPGYPLLMIPWLASLPHNPVLAPFRTNQTIGLLMLLGCFAFYYRIGRPLAGGLAAVLLSTQPGFVTYSRSSMSDLSSAAVAALAFALVYLGLRARRRWPIYCSSVVLGLSLLIKVQMLFFSPLLISMAFFFDGKSRGNWFLHCATVVFVFFLAASFYFLFNTWQFGGPLKTGYDFWVPAFTAQAPFSFHNFPRHLAMIWSELTLSRNQFGVANLFGTGSFLWPTFAILAVVGVLFLRPSPFVFSALLAEASFCLTTATYSFVDGRFYLSVILLLIPLAVLPVEWAVARFSNSRYRFLTVGIFILFVLSCAGYPSESGIKSGVARFGAWDAFLYPGINQRARCYEAEKRFSRAFAGKPGIVLSDIDPVYLNALLPTGFIAAPLDGNHSYCYSQKWHYETADAVRLVRGAIARDEPVYALLASAPKEKAEIEHLPMIGGYKWLPKATLGTKIVVLTLAKNVASVSGLTLDSRYVANRLLPPRRTAVFCGIFSSGWLAVGIMSKINRLLSKEHNEN